MKKVLLALTLVALMASVAFAAIPVKLECIGLLGGALNGLVDDPSSTSAKASLAPLAATAVSFGVTDAVSLGIGAINVSTDDTYNAENGPNTTTGLYVNGYYKIMSMGAISHSIGLEAALLSGRVLSGSDWLTLSAQTLNLNWRTSAKVLGEVAILADVELISLGSASVDGTSTGAVTTLLENAKVGLSIPLMTI